MNSVKLDEDKQSRQMATYGQEAMKTLSTARVLVFGMDGLGAEVSKNLVLANIHSIVLHDDSPLREEDLSSQFLLSQQDVGSCRGSASVAGI